MKLFSEKQALLKLAGVKSKLRDEVAPFERRAKSCQTCETKGACCLDAHFVNVHITKLEAVAMQRELSSVGAARLTVLKQMIDETIETFGLNESADSFSETYSCPLFDPARGCLVHSVKPTACIVHACYENAGDLPPDEIQTRTEQLVSELNERTYRTPTVWLPIPVFIKKIFDRD